MNKTLLHQPLLPPSTPEHQALLQDRRTSLRAELEQILDLTRAPLTLEIGCGHGHFLAAYAHAHPAEVCIGVDIESARIERAARKKERANLPNLHFVRADARLLLEVLPPAVQLGRIFVLFPDPWPKSRHHKHRLMQANLLTHLATRTNASGRLFFRTDYAPYAEATNALIEAHADWQRANDPWPFEFETVFQSRADRFHSLIARRTPAA